MNKTKKRNNYFTYNNFNNQKVNYKSLKFGNNSKLGEGEYGKVYSVKNTKNRSNNRLVVKHSLGYNKSMNKYYDAEIEVIKELSKKNITARIVYVDYEKYYYVMEKMDYTLREIIKTGNFTLKIAKKLINLLIRLAKTKYRNNDLHMDNIMYSIKLNDFRIIDWGIFEILKTKAKFNNISSNNNLYHKKNDIYIKGPALVVVLYYIYTKKNEYSSDKQWSTLYNKLSILMNRDIDKELVPKWYNVLGTSTLKKKNYLERYKQDVSRVETKRTNLNINNNSI